MRTSITFGFVLVTSLAACGGGTPGGGDDTVTPPDAPTIDPPPPARGFQVISKEVTIQPGQEITYCYYFRTPNTEPMAINKWTSTMTPGSHHMIMLTSTNDIMPPGTLSATNCGFFSGGNLQNVAVWTYSAQSPQAELDLPSDDGNGKPLAQDIAANTPAYFQMHYLNATDAPIQAHVTLNAEALDAGATYTKTAAFVTYNDALSIPDNSVNLAQTKTCGTPASTKFWEVSTHAHKQAVHTEVMNGSTVAFASSDWAHPGIETWMQTPFYSFANNQMTFTCNYTNHTGRTITSGESAATDEMCMATGYFFPATKPVVCYCPKQSPSCFNF